MENFVFIFGKRIYIVYNFTLNASMKVLIIFALKAYILQLKSKKVCLFYSTILVPQNS